MMGQLSRLFSLRHRARVVRSRFFSTFFSETDRSEEEPVLDRIDLKSLQLYGFHGMLYAEKAHGQRFVIDTTLFLPLKTSGVSDNIKDTVNYVSVMRDLEKIMKGPSVDLIEHLAELMCYRILEGYPMIKQVQISIKKPDITLPPPTDSFGYVGVTLFRKRDDFDFGQRGFEEDLDFED